MVFEFAISISAVVRIGDPFVDLVPEGIGKRNAVLFINRRYHRSGISDEIPETDVMQSWVVRCFAAKDVIDAPFELCNQPVGLNGIKMGRASWRERGCEKV